MPALDKETHTLTRIGRRALWICRVMFRCLLLSCVPMNLVQASDLIQCVQSQYETPKTLASKLADPAAKGEYAFENLHYGPKGHWFNFSTPDLVTSRIELPGFLADYSRHQGYTENAYHEFDANDLALTAKVWVPTGPGPFPLIMLVHGNSDPGFDYLGDMLATRGYLVAQIDQTYLNGLWGENGARGWILLEHLNVWRDWNAQPTHPFYQKVDMQRIALIGMSRGGEAVALAAHFNRWNTLPGEATQVNFDFAIQGVVALAPMDGQYQHASGSNTLNDLDYLVLQGGHDADVYQFLGSQQWHRTAFTDDSDHLKQAIYLYRGNHINFNQDMSGAFHWGQRGDFDANLLSPAQQEQATKVLVSAFLESSIHARHEYRTLLHQPPQGQFGLPQDIYVSRYATSDMTLIEDFETEPHKVALFRSNDKNDPLSLPIEPTFEKLRHGQETTNKVLPITLPKGVESRLRFSLPSVSLSHPVEFRFSLARTDVLSTAACQPNALLKNAQVRVMVADQVVDSVSLASLPPLPPVLLSDFSELENSDWQYPVTEPLLQTYSIPLPTSKLLNLAEDKPSDIALELVFFPAQDTEVIVDDIGMARRSGPHHLAKPKVN